MLKCSSTNDVCGLSRSNYLMNTTGIFSNVYGPMTHKVTHTCLSICNNTCGGCIYSKNELISKVKGEAYFTYTLTLYGVLRVAPDRPSLNTHLHKPNMNEYQNFLHNISKKKHTFCKLYK